MSVPEYERGERKMQVFMKANELAIYTIKICCNPKIFLPEYQNALTNDIIRTAKDIFIYAWQANSIRVTSIARKDKRRELQDCSIQKCNDLLALIQMAQRLYHLKLKRIKYWGEQTIEVRELLKKWRDADIKRYADIK